MQAWPNHSLSSRTPRSQPADAPAILPQAYHQVRQACQHSVKLFQIEFPIRPAGERVIVALCCDQSSQCRDIPRRHDALYTADGVAIRHFRRAAWPRTGMQARPPGRECAEDLQRMDWRYTLHITDGWTISRQAGTIRGVARCCGGEF